MSQCFFGQTGLGVLSGLAGLRKGWAALAGRTSKGARSGRAQRLGRWLAFCLAATMLGSTGLAQAGPGVQCPTPVSITVASGGNYSESYLGRACSLLGLGDITRAPSHGTLQSTLSFNAVNYTNGGDGALSDTFSFLDDSAGEIVYNVTIQPASSPITLSPATLPATLPAPTTANSYSQTLSATGGVAPYTYSVASGGLPAGMSLLSSGTLFGTPTAAGPFTFTVKVQDSTAPTALTTTKSYALTVPFPVLTLPASLPGAALSAVYSQQLSTLGGTAPYSYTIQATSGNILPPGISLSTSGLLSGTPTTVGSYTFSVKVMDSTSGTGPAADAYDMTIVVTAAPVIALTPTTLPPGQAGASYSATLTASGASAPYAFTISSGALPLGLSLSTAGVLSGTSTVVGSFPFTVKATDPTSQSGTQPYTLTMAAPKINLAPLSLPAMTDGVAISPTTLLASGGTAPYTYSVWAGAFPAGVVLAADGTVSGKPTAAGVYSVTVRATDNSAGPAGSYFGARAYSGTVAGPPVAGAVSATVAYGSTANPISLNSIGGTPTSVAISTAAQHGTATASGTSLIYTPTAGYAGWDSFTYTLTNGAGTSAPATVTMTVSLPSAATTPSTGWSTQSGAAYSQTLTWSGGHAPYSAFATGLPAGLSVTGTTSTSLTISGTPTQAGTFPVTFMATDSSTGDGPFNFIMTYPLTVARASVSLAPAGTGLTAVYGTAYSEAFTASGGVAPYTYTYTSTGGLPAGVSFNASTGTLSGTPVVAGNFSFSVTATDRSTGAGAPSSVTVGYTLTISPPAVTMTRVLPAGALGQAYSTQITASGGIAPYSYQVSGSLPAGVQVNSAGLLSGTPTASGSFSLTVQAADSHGFTGVGNYVLFISGPTLTLTPAALPIASATVPYSVTMVTVGGTAPYRYSIEANSLPSGLTLDSATGVLSGTTVAAGTFPIAVRATDSATGVGAPFSVKNNYSLVVNPSSISLSPATVPGGTVGAPYGVTFSTSGGTAPYTYSVPSGALPTGVTLAAGGLLSGTPRAAGSFNATVQVTDANGFTASQPYTLTIGAPTVSLTPATLPNPTAGTAYSTTLTAAGGTAPYTFSVSGGALPAGLTINAFTGVLSGTTNVAGSFSFSIRATDSSTGVDAPFSATQSYTVTGAAPTITVSPANPAGGKVAVAYSQTFTAAGGIAPYAYTVTSGAVPTGLTLNSSTGTLTGTPTAWGNVAFTVQAKDTHGFTGQQAVTVSIDQAVPVAVDDTASTLTNQAVTVPVTANDSGPITSVAITTAPANGTATVSGLNVVYTPANNFFGTDTLRYTATGSGGTSAPATLTVTVIALPVPVALPQTATVLAGQPVTVHAAQGATGGPFTAVAITSPPATGSAVVSGTDIVYTPAADGSGDVRLSYTLANAFGASAPVTATITVNPLPQAGAHDATVSTGAAVNIDLMPGATGGPFSAAAVVSLTPAAAGTAVIRDIGTAGSPSYQMTFTAAGTFSGSAVISYTLRNAYATSAPGRVTVTVTPRRDMSSDAEVTGLLAAQASSARRFASTQLSNFSRRLESLHGDGWGRSDFGISLAGLTSGAAQDVSQQPGVESDRMVGSPFQSGMRKTGWSSRKGQPATGFGQGPGGTAMAAADPAAAGNALPNLSTTESRDNARQSFSWWVGGAIDYGRQDANNPQEGYKFTTSGLSVGGDYRLSDRATIGLGAGFSSDSSNIGSNGSKSSADSAVAVVYGSLRPARDVFIDGVLGYGKLRFDATRYITGVGGFANGSRRGDQVFGSLSSGVEYRGESWMWSPYGRLELSSATLDAYTETAPGLNALTYFKQTVRSTNGILGLRAEGHYVTGLGLLVPRMRVEFSHRFEGADEAGLSYADLAAGGPAYIVRSNGQDVGNWTAALGARLVLRNGVALSVDFNTNLNMNRGRSQSLMFGVAAPF